MKSLNITVFPSKQMCSILLLHAQCRMFPCRAQSTLLMFFHLFQQCPWEKIEWKLFFQKLNIKEIKCHLKAHRYYQRDFTFQCRNNNGAKRTEPHSKCPSFSDILKFVIQTILYFLMQYVPLALTETLRHMYFALHGISHCHSLLWHLDSPISGFVFPGKNKCASSRSCQIAQSIDIYVNGVSARLQKAF